MEHKDSLLDVLRTLLRWRKPIGIALLVTLIGSVVIALLLPNYYQATTVFFAASADVTKPEHILGKSNKDTEYFGNNNDIDRLLAVAQSDELFSFLVEKYNLYGHYDIDSTAQRAPFYVKRKLLGHFDLEKTKRDAVELSIEDKDPVLAAAMVTDARNKIDEILRRLTREGVRKMISTVQADIEAKNRQLEQVSIRLTDMRNEYGILSSVSQSEALASMAVSAQSAFTRTEARLRALEANPVIRGAQDTIKVLTIKLAGMRSEVDSLAAQINRFNNGVAKVDVVGEQYRVANEDLSLSLERLQQLETALNSDVSTIILIEEAAVPIMKSRPHRTLIVLGSLIVVFMFSIIAVLIFENYREVRFQDLLRESSTPTVRRRAKAQV